MRPARYVLWVSMIIIASSHRVKSSPIYDRRPKLVHELNESTLIEKSSGSLQTRKGGHKLDSNHRRSIRNSKTQDDDVEFRKAWDSKFNKVLTKEDYKKKTHELAYEMAAEGSTDAEVLNKIILNCLDPAKECSFDIHRMRTDALTHPPPTQPQQPYPTQPHSDVVFER